MQDIYQKRYDEAPRFPHVVALVRGLAEHLNIGWDDALDLTFWMLLRMKTRVTDQHGHPFAFWTLYEPEEFNELLAAYTLDVEGGKWKRGE